MLDPTPLDRAHAATRAAPDNDAARLRFYERLADAELFVMLRTEPDGQDIEPEIFEVDGTSFVLVFDREDRLATFAGGPVPYVALSGRNVAQMLAGQAAGLGVNLGVPASETLLPPTAVAWLAATLAGRPKRIEARPVALSVPDRLPDLLVSALGDKLAAAGGLAQRAYLAGVQYDGAAGAGHLLAFIDTLPGAEDALARACGEALIFSGIADGEIDVAFFAGDDPVCDRLDRVGLRFELPRGQTETAPPGTHGLDPTRPPRLR